MATDGVKIIGSDIAHDVYNSFMEMYTPKVKLYSLMEKYEQDKNNYAFDDVTYELCVTAYAFAFWEIGFLPENILKDVEKVIAKKASVIDWAEEVGEETGLARQTELDEFWKKINSPNPKPRQPEKKNAKNPIYDKIKKEVNGFSKVYYEEKRYQEVANKCKFILDNHVESLDKLKEYSTSKRNNLLNWLFLVQEFYMKSLIQLGKFENAVEEAKRKIELNKHLVDYFEGFFHQEEVLIYQLYIVLKDTKEIENWKKRLNDIGFSEKQIADISEPSKVDEMIKGY